MSVFTIINSHCFKNSNNEDIHCISYELNSNYLSYDMKRNFIIMEKTPDYLFCYFEILMKQQDYNNKSSLDMTIKSLDDHRVKVTLNTNNIIFFNTIKENIQTFKHHFKLFLSDYSCLDNQVNFLQKFNKINLFDRLENNLVENNHISKKPKL